MIQGGGFEANMKQKATRDTIKNEADNGLKNVRGSLSMARTSDVNSATSQFFVNVADNKFLDNGPQGFGYAVFAKVVDGMDVVDKIVAVKTGSKAGHQDVPLEPVVVNKAVRT
jgi:cyclophilin family peptidyl-prolyl cis-trans isomerase